MRHRGDTDNLGGMDTTQIGGPRSQQVRGIEDRRVKSDEIYSGSRPTCRELDSLQTIHNEIRTMDKPAQKRIFSWLSSYFDL